jgi:hypothetical protein
MQRNINQMKQPLRQSAIVQSVNHKTLAIRYAQKVVYAEATGVVILTDQSGHSQTNPTQWAMLFYIKDIIDGHNTIVNRYGLYLQNIVPQTPGTSNPTAPKPTGEELPGNSQTATLEQTTPEAPPLPSTTVPTATPALPPKNAPNRTGFPLRRRMRVHHLRPPHRLRPEHSILYAYRP